MKKKWGAVVAIVLIAAVASLAFAQNDAPKYYGSTKSDKYHKEGCRYIEKIKDENLIIFRSVKEAQEADYVGCKVCKPPSEGATQKKRDKSRKKSGKR